MGPKYYRRSKLLPLFIPTYTSAGASRLDVLHHAGIDRVLESILEPIILLWGMTAWPLAGVVSSRQLLLHSLVCRGKEDDLAVRRLGHGLHRLEVSDLHGRSRRKNIGSLGHS